MADARDDKAGPDILHPTYGSLESLMDEIATTIRGSYLPRMGHLAAMQWFAYEYGKARAAAEAAGKHT